MHSLLLQVVHASFHGFTSSMIVPMMGVREVRMRMGQGFVSVSMTMIDTGGHWMFAGMPMMFVVIMLVIVFQSLMGMSMLVALG